MTTHSQPDAVHAASLYIAADRRQALARGETPPERTSGAALFADVSGFTPLTEALTEALGLRRGAEELPRILNEVYDALIAVVDRYGGSVIGFAGDAITCWFDDMQDLTGFPKPVRSEVASGRAVACALAMQAAMRQFAAVPVRGRAPVTLAVKVAVASGSARRLAVGDPAIQRKDVLAGAMLTRLAVAEHLADKGHVVVDAETAAALGALVDVREWLLDASTQARFAVVGSLKGEVPPASWPALSPDALAEEQVRPWVLPVIYERLAGGLGNFLTELRPAAALFVRFGGIDYDGDEAAGAKLDAYIRWVQGIIARYEGTLVQLTVGDKGSYLYAAFGAPIAHEDDARRAVVTALTLRTPPADLAFIGPVQIGISRGTMRTGTYGAKTRHTYGVLGDDVNLAARLMSLAAPDEVLVSGRIHKALTTQFTFEPRPPIHLKGKAEPLPVFAVTGALARHAIRLQEPTYALPMVGRQQELRLIEEKIAQALSGKGQVVGITAEAGMGKSRLVAEAIRLARRRNLTGYGGACQADGANISYLVWGAVFRGLFGVDLDAPLRRQIRNLEGEAEDLAPDRADAIPLLTAVLGFSIPDNDFTRNLEAQHRKSALEALLLECLRTAARGEGAGGGGLLLVLEDLHWIDPVSDDLLERVAREIADLPVLILLAYRPPEVTQAQAPRVEKLPHFTKIRLTELNAAEAELAIRAKLAQLFPERGEAVPASLIQRVSAQAQGNPFYVEELINYLHDRGLDPHDATTLELPTSLHSLILSRIDHLSARQQLVLKVASVIGRVFRFAHLHGYYPALDGADQVKRDLEELRRLDLTPLESAEPELVYLFKHIVTREVAYENLPYATRANLHEAYARYLETVGAQGLAPLPVDALAYHYGLSENLPKKWEYLRRAGDAAAGRYANAEAVNYYEQLLPLLTESSEQMDILLKLGAVLEHVGRWPEAEARYRGALALATGADVPRCQQILGHLAIMRTDYPAAQDWLEQARAGWQALGDKAGLSRTLAELGFLMWRKGEQRVAQGYLKEGLALARELDDRRTMAFAINYLANVLMNQGEYTTALPLRQECLALRREMNDKHGLCIALDNYGLTVMPMGEYAMARTLFEESIRVRTEVGDRWGRQRSLNSLGELAFREGDFTTAKKYFEECLKLALELEERHEIKLQYDNLGILARLQGDYAAAHKYLEDALALNRELGDRGGVANSLYNLGSVSLEEGDFATAQALFVESLALMRECGERDDIPYDLLGLAAVASGRAARADVAEASAQARRAARLAGVGAALMSAKGIVMDHDMRPLYEKAVAGARAALDEAAFAAAFAEGQAMTEEQAVAYALEA